MKLLDSILDEVQKYLAKSILEPNVEFEYKFKGILTNEKFRNLMEYCKDKYTNPITSITLDITFENSDLRVTLDDLHSIKSYCKADELDKTMNVSYMKKKRYDGERGIESGDIKFNLKQEIELNDNDYDVDNIKKSWKNRNKIFRYKYRTSYTTSDKLFRIDVTAVKTNRYIKDRKLFEFNKSFAKAKILQNEENYELEVEYIGNEKGHIHDFIQGNITEEKSEPKNITSV